MKTFVKVLIIPLLLTGLFHSPAEAQRYLAGAGVNGKWGFIDTSGKWVIHPVFDEVRNFSEGLAGAKEGEKWGYITSSGEWAIQPFCKRAEDFSEGLARVIEKNSSSWNYIDKTGKQGFLKVGLY
jgi:hypothetical protein